MNAPIARPLLEGLQWKLAKTREGVTYGTIEYSAHGNYESAIM